MYLKNHVPGYLIVTKDLDPPVQAYVHETWVFPLKTSRIEEPTIIRYENEELAREGHIQTMVRFIKTPEDV